MKVYIFFNCDDNKSETSMNIFYNKFVYKDSGISRKKLFEKIKSEQKAGRVQIAEENLDKIENLIMKGDPVEASKFIRYGAIKTFNCI